MDHGKARQSGVELLRIILMLQVIFLHVCTKGKYSSIARSSLGPNHALFYWNIWLMCRGPVYNFMLLSGYFSVTSRRSILASVRRIGKYYRVMLFYAFLIPLSGQIFGVWDLGKVQIVRMFIPLISGEWYFMTLYVLLQLFSPYLNRALNGLSKREYQVLLAVSTVFFSILPMLTRFEVLQKYVTLSQVIASEGGGKGLYGAVYMYMLGGYLRLHVKGQEKARARFLVIFFAINCFNVFLRYRFPAYRVTQGTNDNILVILQGVCLLLFFRDLKFSSKLINYIASLTLGVYMIHEHRVLRGIIWNRIFAATQTKSFYMTWKYPVKILLICLSIFAVCGLIEAGRLKLFAYVEKRWAARKAV